QFDGAARLFQRIIDFPEKKARKDLREISRLLQIIVEIERGDHDYAESLLQRAYQYFLRNHYAQFHRTLIEHLRRYLRETSSAARDRSFHDLIRYVDDHIARGAGMPFGMVEVRVWADARTRGIPWRDAFMEFLKSLEG
ncbi:MAG: hypothetical protein AAF570_25355, partial [Bacteroidota bacterium]